MHIRACPTRRNLAPRTPRGPHASAMPPLPPEHPVLSLPHLIHSNYSLSNPKPWRSFTLSSTIEASSLRRSLAGASPEHRRRSTPTSYTTRSSLLPWGGAYPTSSSSTPSPASSPKQGRQPRATPSLPRRLEALAGILLDAGECFPSPIHPPLP